MKVGINWSESPNCGIFIQTENKIMPDWLRALIAGYSAKKLGGGCFSTILVFVIVYFALGQCNHKVQHGAIITHPATTSTHVIAVVQPAKR
jgi:hypothetical protein